MSDTRDIESLFGPGRVFAEGREALDMSRSQMADVLNLPVRTIAAIEENNRGALPDAVYVNGYMRSYSKLLGLASQPLIDAWWAQHVENEEQEFIEEQNDEIVEKAINDRPFKMGRWAVAGLVVSVGFVYFVSNSNQQTASDDADRQVSDATVLRSELLLEGTPTLSPELAQVAVQDASSEPVQAPDQEAEAQDPIAPALEPQPARVEQDTRLDSDSEIAEPAAVERDTSTRLAEREIVNPSTDEVSTTETVVNEAAGPSELETEREQPLAFALPRLTEFGDNVIVLSFTADCWFEIRNESGQLLYADLGRDTQTRRYVGEGPFQIKLGFSPGATLRYNDETVDLQPYTRRDVANVTVGETAQDAQPALQTSATQATLLW